MQRIYKFGGQPYFNDYLTTHYKAWFQKTFGDRNGKSVMSATAGRYVDNTTLTDFLSYPFASIA